AISLRDAERNRRTRRVFESCRLPLKEFLKKVFLPRSTIPLLGDLHSRAQLNGPNKRRTTMKISALPKDADALVAFAESTATALAERQECLGIGTEVEAPLRAAIAAATYASDAYVAAWAHAEKSANARSFLAEAK